MVKKDMRIGRKERLEMSEKEMKVTKEETLRALRTPGELYVVMSGATKLPLVWCDEETFDDEVFLYYGLEDAKTKARQLLEEKKYITAVAKLEDNQLLSFYTSLYTMGVNALAVNVGTDIEIHVQLAELVTRKAPENLPEGQQIVENPALHLTAIYYMQEIRRQVEPELSDHLKELQEELMAHYGKGTYLVAVGEDGQLPILKQKDGTMFQPIFTDMLEFQKFTRGNKVKTAVIPGAKIAGALMDEVEGVVLNPMGVNVQLHVSREHRKREEWKN